jgi:RES domain-containing protein
VPLKLFRLGTAAFPVWDGAGAAAQGDRWNPPGISVIYAAGTLSLAMLERLVQRRNLGQTLLVEAKAPAGLAVEDLMARPPPNWRALGSPEAMAEGGRWLASG